jgi:hypothetical protein
MEPATAIVLVAGTMTFANEWYQTKQVNWRVPVATLLLAAVFDGISHLDRGIATTISVMVLIGAATTDFNGKSVADTVSSLFTNTTPAPGATKVKG